MVFRDSLFSRVLGGVGVVALQKRSQGLGRRIVGDQACKVLLFSLPTGLGLGHGAGLGHFEVWEASWPAVAPQRLAGTRLARRIGRLADQTRVTVVFRSDDEAVFGLLQYVGVHGQVTRAGGLELAEWDDLHPLTVSVHRPRSAGRHLFGSSRELFVRHAQSIAIAGSLQKGALLPYVWVILWWVGGRGGWGGRRRG
ncbi:hypothetical protein ABZ468_54090 [Streptomyces sp. NPDC005708]|uniref:hypothetical protein n=1 Tax=Streptomyces sp. NPDC005708 TaxID=3154564 RepID=UPI0033D1835B